LLKATEVALRLVLPLALLSVGLLLLWYGTTLLQAGADTSVAWGVLTPSIITVLLGVATLVLMNTKKARERWRPFTIPADEPRKHDSDE
jgi:hypothetical protein